MRRSAVRSRSAPPTQDAVATPLGPSCKQVSAARRPHGHARRRRSANSPATCWWPTARSATVARRIDTGDAEIVDAADYRDPARLRRFASPHLAEPDPPHRLDWDLPRMFVELFKRFGPNIRPGGRLRGDPVRPAGRARRRRHHHARLGAHPEFARSRRCGDPRAARGRRRAPSMPTASPASSRSAGCGTARCRIRRTSAACANGCSPATTRLVTLAMAARGPEFTTIETVEHDVRLARELGLADHHSHRTWRQRTEIPRHRAHARAQSARTGHHLRALLQLQRSRIPPDGRDRHHRLGLGPDRRASAAALACPPPAACWRTASARASASTARCR